MSIQIDKGEGMVCLTKAGIKNLSFKELCEINKYSKIKIQKEINYGLSSTLYLALNELNQKVVVKIFNGSNREAYLKEKEFFEKNQNFQNIIKVYDYGLILNKKDQYFGHYYLIMEYAEKGDLINYIEQQKNNENEAKK